MLSGCRVELDARSGGKGAATPGWWASQVSVAVSSVWLVARIWSRRYRVVSSLRGQLIAEGRSLVGNAP